MILFLYQIFFTTVAGLVLLRYVSFLFLASFHPLKIAILRRSFRKQRRNIYAPRVSVIIPAWNEEIGIRRTIESVLKSTYNNIEIVVIDDGSTDNTSYVINQVRLNNPTALIHHYHQQNRGKASALNNGISHSNGEIIVTIDADSVCGRDTIQKIVEYFHDPNVDAIVGNIKIARNLTFWGRIQHIEYLLGFYFKQVFSLFNGEYVMGGACTAFRKSTTFMKIGLYSEDSKTEDLEYSMRMKSHGLKTMFAPNAIVYTEGASTLVSLYKQRLRWKKGKIETLAKYRNMIFSTNPRHNKFLTFLVLPYTLVDDFRLLFEPYIAIFVILYSFYTGNFTLVLLNFWLHLISYIVVFNKKEDYINLPFYLLGYYILMIVESWALIKAIVMEASGEGIRWQTWERRGVSLE